MAGEALICDSQGTHPLFLVYGCSTTEHGGVMQDSSHSAAGMPRDEGRTLTEVSKRLLGSAAELVLWHPNPKAVP